MNCFKIYCFSNAYVGVAISNLLPTVSGTPTNYSVSPSLPNGLVLNLNSGIISGTPNAYTSLQSYTVTASNSSGATQFTLNFVVNPTLVINSPASIAGRIDAGSAAFGPQNFSISGSLVLVNDGVDTVEDGCTSPFNNAAGLSGKIALLMRGNCSFPAKVKLAQDNGAVAAIVFGNSASALQDMGGIDPLISIPSFYIIQADGINIVNSLGSTVNITMSR